VAILQELSSSNNEFSPKLILGFEEPEIFQHPPQERHIANLLEELSKYNSQIIITTHSPYFVPGKGFENIRMIRKDKKAFDSQITQLTISMLEKILSEALEEKVVSPTSMVATIEQIMQPSLKELFFTPNAILVEGIEDVAFISTYFKLLNNWSDFRKYGCHFIVTEGKTNMSRPLAIANAFRIPCFAIFDGDGECKQNEVKRNKRDNTCISKICGIGKFNPLSKEIIWGKNIIMWPVDISSIVKKSFDNGAWVKVEEEVKKENGWEGVGKKNCLLIAATLEKLWNKRQRSSVLEKLCRCILDFAKNGFPVF
jgi:predicted ATP-dependent endonuclease of OLD family